MPNRTIQTPDTADPLPRSPIRLPCPLADPPLTSHLPSLADPPIRSPLADPPIPFTSHLSLASPLPPADPFPSLADRRPADTPTVSPARRPASPLNRSAQEAL